MAKLYLLMFIPILSSEVTKTVLDNGLTVLIKEVYPASVINLCIWVKVGSVYEIDKEAGVSHFIEHMLFKGTSRRKVGEIAREIQARGGYLNAYTSYECTCYWIVLPSKFLDVALDVQSDAIMNSTFDPEEFARETRVIIEEIRMYDDKPEIFSFERLMELAFVRHNYRRPIIGYEDVLQKMRREDVIEYYHNYYRPNNMIVTLVGDITPGKSLHKIERAFAGFKTGNIPGNPSPPEPEQSQLRIKSFQGDIQRTYLQMGFHIPGLLEKDIYACRILAAILGMGRSSRFNQELKEKLLLVDYIEAGVSSYKDSGIFYISAILDADKLEAVKEAIFKEIQRIGKEEVAEVELKKARHMLESYYILSCETVEGLGKNLGYYEVLGDYTLADRYISELYNVTPDEVNNIATKYLDVNNCSMVIYSPRKANQK